MLLPALPVVILWIALPLAALLVFRNSSLPTMTASLTLTAGLLAAIAISLPAGMMGNVMSGTTAETLTPQSGAQQLLARHHYLIALAMWLFGAGGLVLFAGGLAKGAKAGLLRGLGAFGLLLLYIAAGLQVARSFLPLSLAGEATARQQPMHDMISSADMASAAGFLAGSVLILVLALLTLLSRIGRG